MKQNITSRQVFAIFNLSKKAGKTLGFEEIEKLSFDEARVKIGKLIKTVYGEKKLN